MKRIAMIMAVAAMCMLTVSCGNNANKSKQGECHETECSKSAGHQHGDCAGHQHDNCAGKHEDCKGDCKGEKAGACCGDKKAACGGCAKEAAQTVVTE